MRRNPGKKFLKDVPGQVRVLVRPVFPLVAEKTLGAVPRKPLTGMTLETVRHTSCEREGVGDAVGRADVDDVLEAEAVRERLGMPEREAELLGVPVTEELLVCEEVRAAEGLGELVSAEDDEPVSVLVAELLGVSETLDVHVVLPELDWEELGMAERVEDPLGEAV